MPGRSGGGGAISDATATARAGQGAVASVLIAGEEFRASPDLPFVFGRADAEAVVGLDGNDMGISAVAGSLEFAWGGGGVVTQPSRRVLRFEARGGPAYLDLAPGRRYAVTTERVNILVPGAIYTHVLEIVLP